MAITRHNYFTPGKNYRKENKENKKIQKSTKNQLTKN